jgi:dolichol-phosphate mannosyltransferase
MTAGGLRGGFYAPPAPPRRPPLLSVVFSFRNEAEVLGELIRRMRGTLAPLRASGRLAGWELIFVDDDSTDRSRDVLLAEAGAGDIRVITMSRTFGTAPCVLAGLELSRGDLVVYMDADLQDPPELIPRLLSAWESEPEVDVVHTIRVRRDGESWAKLAITRIGYAVLRRVATVDLPIEAGDFKLLSRRAVNLLVEFREKRPFTRGLVCWIGLRQLRVPYHREARFGGRTKFPVLGGKVIQNFLDSAVISFSDVPLKLAMALGLVISALALVLMAWIVVHGLGGHGVPGQAVGFAALLCLGGVQLVFIGVLGLYVSSIFVETKRRPNYIVRETFGFPEGGGQGTDAPGGVPGPRRE